MTDPLDVLRQRVVADPALCRRLADVDARRAVDAIVAQAQAWGLAIERHDVEQAMMSARRRWWEVWV